MKPAKNMNTQKSRNKKFHYTGKDSIKSIITYKYNDEGSLVKVKKLSYSIFPKDDVVKK